MAITTKNAKFHLINVLSHVAVPRVIHLTKKLEIDRQRIILAIIYVLTNTIYIIFILMHCNILYRVKCYKILNCL